VSHDFAEKHISAAADHENSKDQVLGSVLRNAFVGMSAG
jgi:hypothetical protein